jgi:hypothetical protein
MSPGAFALLCTVTRDAARGLAAVGERFYDASQRGRFFLALAGLTLELLASPEVAELFAEAYAAADALTRRPA